MTKATSKNEPIEELDIATVDPMAKKAGKEFPGWLYGVLFVLFDAVGVAALQIGVSESATRVQLSNNMWLTGWGFVGKMFTSANFVAVLNLILWGVLYVILLMLTNRFWVATPVFLAVTFIIAVIEHFKVSIRYEAILPSDLNFLKADAGNLMSFMPSGAQWTILIAVAAFAAFVALFVFLNRLDARHGRLFRGSDKRSRSVNAIARLLLILLPGLFFTLYSMQVSTVGSWAKGFATVMGDKPSMWDSVYDAQRNGPLVAFTRQLNPKVMVKPDDYSEETMKQVAARYEKAAKKINAKRSANMTDSTVIYVLSESFSDPSRVPGLKVNKDSIPNIRKIKQNTTSGLMLSSGYGGGTANLEYMGLSGLSMANFDSSLTSPYQQLVPSEHWTPTINQMWGASKNSIGLHPYESSMYSRATNYKKFGFSHFYTLTGPDVISHQDKIDDSPYVSDEATYQSTLEEVRKTKSNQFLQVITMQNHMPYHDWYKHNDFKASSTTGKPLKDDEKESIETYQKGASLTDGATAGFLSELDKLDKPVTVVFYGDHLPGIYSSASADDGQLAGVTSDGLLHLVQQSLRHARQQDRQRRILVAELLRGPGGRAHGCQSFPIPGVPHRNAFQDLRHGTAGREQHPRLGPHPRRTEHLSGLQGRAHGRRRFRRRNQTAAGRLPAHPIRHHHGEELSEKHLVHDPAVTRTARLPHGTTLDVPLYAFVSCRVEFARV